MMTHTPAGTLRELLMRMTPPRFDGCVLLGSILWMREGASKLPVEAGGLAPRMEEAASHRPLELPIPHRVQ